MKKLLGFVLLILLLIIGYKYISNKELIDNNFLSLVESEEGIITNYYIYGNHLNIEGSIDYINSDNFDLVLKNEKKEIKVEANFERKDNKIVFYISDLINDGINLDKLSLGNYYLLLKSDNNGDIKYYSLKNNTSYENLNYYTVTKNNSNKKINIVFDNILINNKKVDYVNLKIKKNKLPSNVYDITIDPGHGGIDTGSNYKYNSKTYYESNLTLDIALKIKNNLEKQGFKVLLTRDEDKDLEYYNELGRAVLPNKYQTKLCLSLHLNSDKYNMNYGGVEIYTPNNIDYEFATSLARNISKINGYSKKIDNKINNGVYFNGFDSKSIEEEKVDSIKNNYEPYDIVVGTPKMYMIREVGGKVTNAYVDGRQKKYGKNPYYNSNQTAESYLIELGYISYEKDLVSIINSPNEYSKAISSSIIDYFK